MKRLNKKRSKKAGLPPGSLIHIGEKKRETLELSIIKYNSADIETKVLTDVNELIKYNDTKNVVWVNIDGIHDVETIKKISEVFGLHPLVQEDILNTNQRPKVEDYGDYIYIVCKMLYVNPQSETISEQVSIILGKNYVLTFQEGDEDKKDAFDNVRVMLNSSLGHIRNLGPDYLVYSLLDAIIDNYFYILEDVTDRIEDTEEQLIKQPDSTTLDAIYFLKRETLLLHKLVWPLREVTGILQRRETKLISDSTDIYLRDISDHLTQIMDSNDILRDMLASMLEIYLSSVSNKMNEVMKLLTIISTIFIPLTFIAGIYGMNFENMPETKWKYGYVVFWVIIAVISVFMTQFFKKRKWL